MTALLLLSLLPTLLSALPCLVCVPYKNLNIIGNSIESEKVIGV